MDEHNGVLTGRRVLVVEDDPIIALYIRQVLEAAGAIVLGPAHTLAAARRLAAGAVDCAVLDYRLEGETTLGIAQELEKRNIPYVFQTSDAAGIPAIHRTRPILQKPIIESELVRALAALQVAGEASADPAAPVQEPMSDSATRIRQQELLAELGVSALQRGSLDDLLRHAVKIAADGLQSDFAKVLEYLPHENRLLLRAGVGWKPELIGVATIGADLESPAGYALRTGRPTIANQLENEKRFRTPELLASHGVRRAMNVILQGDGAPFGVLEVDSRSKHDFSEKDIAFLQGAANILGMAIEREQRDRQLHAALEYQTVLVGEINHRIKNSLQLVASVLQLQARSSDNAEAAEILGEAVTRIHAIARVHERLHRGSDVSKINLVDYLADICADLDAFASNARLTCKGDEPLHTSADRAVRVALLVNELVINAVKHGVEGKEGGTVDVRIRRAGAKDAAISVSDNGRGLPPDFRLATSRGLGSRIILSLVDQLSGTLDVERLAPGTRFEIIVPLASDK